MTMSPQQARVMRALLRHGVSGPRARKLLQDASPELRNTNATRSMLYSWDDLRNAINYFLRVKDTGQRWNWRSKEEMLERVNRCRRDRLAHMAFYKNSSFAQYPRLP